MKTPFAIVFLFCTSLTTRSQDLGGYWTGRLTMPGGCFAVNNIEVQLHIKGTTVFGDSYHYENVNYYVKKKLSGSYDTASKKLTLREEYVTTYHIPNTCTICIKNFYLNYSKDGRVETLEGNWDGKIEGTGSDCSVGPIKLSRIKESAFKEIPEVLVDTGRIRLDFYDNATIDGDSITVLVNKQVVVSHQMLSARPITAYVTVDLGNPFFEIEMVADNLGTIPPNTALLIITAGTKKYELFLSSTQTKSAMIRIIYDKEKHAFL
ncbi:MAG: hypothetical protein ACXVLT_02125 [Flavisolibacter sp.]